MIRPRLQEIFRRIELNDECHGCLFLRETEDMFGTGDSPLDFDCKGNCYDCPRVAEKAEEVNEWLSERPDLVELLEETL